MTFFPPLSLLIAMCVMNAIALIAAILLIQWLSRASSRVAGVVAAAGAVLLVLHAFWLNGNPLLARVVQSADAIVWANFSPLFVALLAAGAWRSMGVRWQRWAVVVALALICVVQAYGPLFGRVPATKPPRVSEGVHRQTTLSTCSAAAAATLLGAAGIETTESEMADLCLTREGGTLQLGLYRGLRLKAPDFRTEFLNDDIDAVSASLQPVIASLGAGPSGFNPLIRRVGHSVVIMGRLDDGQLDIADPMTGKRYPMTRDAFLRVWTGEAMRLVPRMK